ncbi:MAG TPA: hypothetical protein VMI52_02055 [Acetobacteraceae bacterium]|nr:hypothetical protein [Acetobacteraceae bacterium]
MTPKSSMIGATPAPGPGPALGRARRGLARGLALALVAGSCLCAPGYAATPAPDAPQLIPSRDVTVTYRIAPDDQPERVVRVAVAAGGQKLRLESPAAPGPIILDRRTRAATMLFAPTHTYTVLPGRARAVEQFLLNEHMRFRREGSARVAGLACTDWAVQSRNGMAHACVTDDGVLLRADGTDRKGRHGAIEAVNVAYGALDEGLFRPPADYLPLDLPRGALDAILPHQQAAR